MEMLFKDATLYKGGTFFKQDVLTKDGHISLSDLTEQGMAAVSYVYFSRFC